MGWIWAGLTLLNLFAGMGVKWLLDRLLGRPVHVVVGRHVPPAASRRVVELDDTMDAIGSGFAAGERSAAARLGAGQDQHVAPRLDPVPEEEYLPAVPEGIYVGEGGGWISGPSLDPPGNGHGQLPAGGGV